MYLIIDSTDFTPGFYLVTEEIWTKIKALPFDNNTATMEQYKEYFEAIRSYLQSDDGYEMKPGVEFNCLDLYSNLSLGAVEGVFAINGG